MLAWRASQDKRRLGRLCWRWPPGSPRQISEAGRRFLAARLERLDRAQIRAIFAEAGMARASLENPFDRPLIEEVRRTKKLSGADLEAHLLDLWTDALLERIEEITTARCPS